MKKIFKGKLYKQVPYNWDERTKENPWLNSQILTSAGNSNTPFLLVTHPRYCCCEYKQAFNIFSFGRLKLKIPFTVIAPPISIDECGFVGDMEILIEDYKNRKGLFLMLNIHPSIKLPPTVAIGKTLSTAIFDNKYKTYDEFLLSLRSSYRRRINKAKKKASSLKWKEIEGNDFDKKMHDLYLNVLNRSKYPIETLGINFFKDIQGQIHVLYDDRDPLAFVLIKWQSCNLHFLFGGMNYTKRDDFDLYYNMLLKIVEIGIMGNAEKVDLGQTAESSKCRVGCQLEEKYMIFFSGNKFANRMVKLFSRFLEYSPPREKYHIFK